MKTDKIIYWIATGLMCLLFLASAGMYFFKTPMVQEIFTALGFAPWVIYPLAAAKILAVVAILSRQSEVLKEWAYAGLFFDALIAFGAHWHVGDRDFFPAIIAIVLILTSRIFEARLNLYK